MWPEYVQAKSHKQDINNMYRLVQISWSNNKTQYSGSSERDEDEE